MKYLRFKRCSLASGIAMAIFNCVSSASWAEAPEMKLEVVEVRGIAASQVRNLNSKRFGEGVTDTITAEDIGKLPDITVADTLQRIPGVQIRRSAGEGSTVNVRGMPQVTTLLNGEQFLSAGSITTVQPDFIDIPSSLISGITVHKSPIASLLAGGISGTLDLQTLRVIDMEEGLTLSGSAEVTQGNESKGDDGKLALFSGYRSDDLGVMFTATYDENTLANHRYGTILDSVEVIGENIRDRRDFNNDGDNDDSFLSQRFYGLMDRETERERLGLSASVQANITGEVEFIGDIFYTQMEDADRRQGIMVDNSRGNNWAFTDRFDARLPADLGGSVYTANRMDLQVRRVSSYSESRTNDRESTNINLQLNYRGNGPLSGSVRYLRGDAQRQHTENVAHGYLSSGAQHGLLRNDGSGAEPANPRGYGPGPIPVGFDRTGKFISLGFAPGFGSDINRYNLVSTYSENNFEEEAALDVLRLDGKYEFSADHLSSFEAGLRYGQREVERETSILVAPFTTGDISADVMWKDSGAVLGDTNGDGEVSVSGGDLTLGNTNYYTDLPVGWARRLDRFGPAGSLGSFHFIDPRVMDDPFVFQNAIYPGNKKLADPARSFGVEEQTQTAYFKLNLEGELVGFPYLANIGAQYITTNLEIAQNLVGNERPCSLCTAAEKIGEETIDRSYTDFLPSMNIAVNLSEDIIVRGAYAKTMTNLDMSQLAGGISVSRTRAGDVLGAQLGVSPDLLVAISGRQNGNPTLQPWRADNYNVSAEWYFNSRSLLSIGLFYMDVESFIENGVVVKGLPDIDGVIRNEVPVSTQINGRGGSIKGIELAYHQAFDFLPAFWRGLGASLNYTYAPSDSSNVDVYGEALPIQDNSKQSANAVLWYDLHGLQLRIAANYRSDRLDRLSVPLGQGVLPVWTESTLYVDVSASYDLANHVSVYLQGSNVSEEFENQYAQWKDYVITQNVFETRWTAGIRARF